MSDRYEELPLEKIYWTSPMRGITDEHIQNMATSLMCQGQIEPIIVKPADEKGLFEGVIGRLRFEGTKRRNGKTILARVHTFKGNLEVHAWQLAENLHRRQLPAMERGKAYKEYFDELKTEKMVDGKGEITTATKDVVVKIISQRIEALTGKGTNEKTVHHYINLTKLPPEAQEILTGEKMGLRHGLELLRVKDPKKQVELIKQAVDRKWTVRELRNQVTWKLEEAKTDRRKAQVIKKAEELRAQGKTVFIDYPPYNFDKYKDFYGDIEPPCDTCEMKGVYLEKNFHQKPICVDLKCHKRTKEEISQRLQAEVKAQNADFDAEKEKIVTLEPDDRHWRLVLFGLFDEWELKRMLDVPLHHGNQGAVLRAILELPAAEVKGLLIRKAVNKVMTRANDWDDKRGVKEWAVKEFGLRPELFLKDEKAKEDLPGEAAP